MKTLLVLMLLATLSQQDKAKSLVEEGNTLFGPKNYGDALARYEEALKLSPKHANALFNGGLAAYLAGKPAKAAEGWERLREQKPEDHQLLAKLVQAYQAAGNLEKRNASRETLLAARAKLPAEERSKGPSYCRDQFSVKGRRVMACENFEMSGDRAIRYRFSVLNDEGKEEYFIPLGSYDITTDLAREAGQIGRDDRLFHLEGSYEGGSVHRTFGMFRKEPAYDEIRKMVVEAIDGQRKPVSGSGKK
jgi:tetratricopeptide (TPR) repeat protein